MQGESFYHIQFIYLMKIMIWFRTVEKKRLKIVIKTSVYEIIVQKFFFLSPTLVKWMLNNINDCRLTSKLDTYRETDT